MKHALGKSIGTLMMTFKSTRGARLQSIDEFHHDVKSGAYRWQVEAIRSACANGAAESVLTQLKAELRLFVCAGDCRDRRVWASMRAPSGYAPFDIDHISAERARAIVAECCQHRWIKASHLSSRGEGVHLFVAMGVVEASDAKSYADEYKRRYAIIARKLSEVFRVSIDEQCKDVLRGMYASWDPDAFCREDSEVEAFDYEEQVLMPAVQSPPGGRKERINSRYVSCYLPYHQYKPSARHAWWISFAQYLRSKGVEPDQLNEYRLAMTEHLEKKGLILADDPTMRSPDEVDNAMAWGWEHSERQAASSGGGSAGGKATKVVLVEEFLKKLSLRYDLISRKVQMLREDGRWAELSDRDVNSLWRQCNLDSGENVPYQVFRPMLLSDCVPSVNPLMEYVTALPEWDGQTDYIGSVADMVKVKDDEAAEHGASFAQCFRKWFVAMVASWLHPDVVNHQVLVLIGEQGIYKTTWLDALMPPELVQYRSKQSSADKLDKDELLRASEFGLVNMDEIDKMGERELNSLKSLITASDINVRAAYGYGKERRVRIASYVASGNKDRFLTDTTGNRRWLPFHVSSIVSPYSHPLPYEGMYAQARKLLEDGFDYWFSLDEIRQLSAHVSEFTVETNEEQLVPVYFDAVPPGTTGAVFLTLAEISAKLTMWGNIKRPMDLRQLGALMKKLGFTSVRRGHRSVRGYVLIEKSAEVINAQRKLDACE